MPDTQQLQPGQRVRLRTSIILYGDGTPGYDALVERGEVGLVVAPMDDFCALVRFDLGFELRERDLPLTVLRPLED